MKTIIVTKSEEGMRFNKFIGKLLPGLSINLQYKFFRKKYFELNGKRAEGKELLKTSDKISIFLSDETYDKFKNETIVKKYHKNENDTNSKLLKSDLDIKKQIVYEDDNIIIFNKPKGMLSQESKNNEESVNSILLSYINKKNNNQKSVIEYKSSIMNRLDRNTEGIILFAKTYIMARELSEMIKKNLLKKYYKAKINGVLEKKEDKLINLYKKDESRNIAIIDNYDENGNVRDGYSVVILNYKVVEHDKNSTLVEVDLVTGKSHQIRAQFSYIGHPIVGDKKYMSLDMYNDNVKKYNVNSQILKCYKIVFAKFNNDNLKYLNNKVFEI